MELKTIGLTKKFGSKAAVNALNITLTNGVYGLLGANGAGKTTLMRLLCNIQTPTSGKILLNGRNIVELGEKYRNLLGYLPQHFGYYPDFSAYDFLIYVSALKGLDEKAARKKSKELLEAVDLSRESKHKIKTFSGGMKQRLGIAQAMLNDPRILILRARPFPQFDQRLFQRPHCNSVYAYCFRCGVYCRGNHYDEIRSDHSFWKSAGDYF